MDCMQNPILQVIKAKYISLEPVLDERARRLWAGAEARAIGRGGITRVAQATGLSRVTVRAGLKELDLPITPAAGSDFLGSVYLTLSTEAKIQLKPVEPRNARVDFLGP